MADNKNWLGGTVGNTTNYGTAANWDASGVPVATDSAFIQGRPTMYDIDAGLNQSAVALALFQHYQSYTGKIGTSAGAYLQVRAAQALLGYPDGPLAGAGSPRLMVDFGSAAATRLQIFNASQQSTDSPMRPTRILGTHADNELIHYGGSVSIAALPLETAQWPLIQLMAQPPNIGSGIQQLPDLLIGIGCAVGDVVINAGRFQSVDVESGTPKTFTSIKMFGGQSFIYGASIITLLELLNEAALFERHSVGTIAQLTIRGGGTFDSSRDPRAITITNATWYADSIIDLRNGQANHVFTNPVSVPDGLGSITLYTDPGQAIEFA